MGKVPKCLKCGSTELIIIEEMCSWKPIEDYADKDGMTCIMYSSEDEYVECCMCLEKFGIKDVDGECTLIEYKKKGENLINV